MNIENNKFLITGGTGSFGKTVCQFLLKKKVEEIILLENVLLKIEQPPLVFRGEIIIRDPLDYHFWVFDGFLSRSFFHAFIDKSG